MKSVCHIHAPPAGLKSVSRVLAEEKPDVPSVVIMYESKLCEFISPHQVVAKTAALFSVPVPDFQVSWAYKPTILSIVEKHNWLRVQVKASDCVFCAASGSGLPC
jgi:hypothetical protein